MRWVIAALLVAAPTNLLAQSAKSGGYVFGGLSTLWEQGVTTGEHQIYLAAPGGWATGFFLGGGAHLAPFLSLEAEWHRTGILEATEPSRYSITYSAQRRDTTVDLGARFHVTLSNHLVLEPVALFEFVREESWLAQRQEYPGLPVPPSGDLSNHTPFVDSWGTGIVGGADVRAGGRHLALMPGVRFHRFWRDHNEDAGVAWPGGVSSWGLEVTVALRADF